MNDKLKTIIYIVIFCVVMAFLVLVYTKLSNEKKLSANDKDIEIKSSNYKKEKLKDFSLSLEDGSKINISSLIGKPIVINVWTSWCAYCKIEMPYFNELYLKEKDNINFVMINVTGDRDTKEDAKKFVNENNFDFNIYYDFTLDSVENLEIYSYPTTIFVDKEGYINYVRVGTITKDELVDKINEFK